MRVISTVAIGALLTLTPGLVGAQRTGPAGAADPPRPDGAMPALTAALSGHWSLQVTFEPSQELPNGLQGTGVETWLAGPQDLTFTDEEVFTAGADTVIVVGVLWQDRKTKEYHAMDCSNQMSHTCDAKSAVDGVVVHWTGRTLTIDEQEPSQGKMMTSRVEWSEITANSFTETGYLAPPDGPFKKIMTIHAIRAAAR